MPRDPLESALNRALADRVERARHTISEALAALAAPVPPGLAGPLADDRGLQPIRAFLDATRSPSSQKDILGALVDAAAGALPRTVLFILRAETLVAWALRGDETDATHMTLPARGDHLAARAVASGATCLAGAEGPGFVMTESLGGPVPSESVAVPLLVRGRVVALLYGDTGSSRAPAPGATLEILGRIGGLVLESFSAGRRVRPATGRSPVATRRMRVEVGASTVGAARRVEGTPIVPLAPLDAATGGFDSWDDGEAVEASVPARSAIAPPEDAEMQALLTDLDGMRQGLGDGGSNPEEQRLHADARRFASLLISEILLYNEEAVILGRRHHDLSRRLGKEIDKSRKAYAARLPGNLRSAARYFEEELVRVLAEGDASAIGA